MGKALKIIIVVVVVAIVAFAAYTLLLVKDNEAKTIQPDLESFPSGWKVDSSYSSTSTGEDVMSFSRERYTDTPYTEHVVVQIYVYSSIDKAYTKYDAELANWSGTNVTGTPFDKCFMYGSPPNYCFVFGNIYGEIIVTNPSTVDVSPIFDDITEKAANVVIKPV